MTTGTEPPTTATKLTTAVSQQLFERSLQRIPGGVNSPVRAMRAVGREHPLLIDRAEGSLAWDVDGHRFTDWVMSWGALPLGHVDADVVEEIEQSIRDGISFGAPTGREMVLAEIVCEAVDSVDKVRFVSSGTEATMTAARLARAVTGRDRLLMFAGCYHGHSDAFLASAGSGLATMSLPASPGVPAAVTANTLVATYNDLDSVEQLFAGCRGEIAAVFVEPVAANMGLVLPAAGFLEGLREICDRHGTLLVFDEVITGFRLAWGGAQQRFGIRPDLTCFGKVVGGGMPVGAVGGRAEIMDHLAPLGAVYQAGTLSGNPVAMAAGVGTLRALRDRNSYALLEQLGTRLATRLGDELAARGAEHSATVTQVGSLVTLFHHSAAIDRAPGNYREARLCDAERFAATHAAALEAGHMLPPSQFEAWFVSAAHSGDQIDELATVVAQAVADST